MSKDAGPGSDTTNDTLPGVAQTHQRLMARRTQIAAEILDTERTYVDGLALIEKLFVTPLLASVQQPSPILSRKEVRQLFANFPDIITLSKELLSQLDARLGPNARPPWDPASGLVGDIFLRMAPFMKMYSLYLRNFRSALADISSWLGANHDFSNFIQQASASPECRGLSFQSYLLLPVQRIPRYKLLLEDLLRHTSDTHVDHQSIGDALRMIEDVAAFVNENIEEHEMTLSIIEIQRTLGLKESLLVPGRRLIRAGTLTKICRKNHQQRSFYLFSDILLYSSGPAPLLDDQTGHRRVPLIDCKVMNVPDAADCRNQFTIISREKSFIVYANAASDKVGWMDALSRAILAQRKARETLQMDRSLKRRLARARRSTMMHYPRVAENFDAPVWDPDESAECCYICFRDFSLFLRRHHCRACGKIVCNACSRKNIVFVDRSSAEPKEGRGCDQCIARMFGREALETPPGTIHKFLSRSRHSLDPGSLLQSLSTLRVGAGNIRHLPISRPSAPWGDSGSRHRNSVGELGSCCTLDRDNGEDIQLPTIAQVIRGTAGCDSAGCGNTGCDCEVGDHSHGALQLAYQAQVNAGQDASHSPSDEVQHPLRPSTPLPAGSSSNRISSATDPASLASSSLPRATRLTRAFTYSPGKHISAGSALEWDAQQVSARSTLLYESSSPTAYLTATSSPMSTISHHRVSFVSSSCSTIGPDPVLKSGHMRSRRPVVFTAGSESPPPGTARMGASSNSHCSLLALYEHPPSTGSMPSLISPVAPPKVTLVQAEAVASRRSRTSTATLCSLCHGDFTMHDSQHQCSSCLTLVCSRCIKHRPGYSAPNFARILSMYIPDGHEHL
ncbi:hypothetical protein IWW50_002916, partial [Coemansia erecta]